MIVVKFFLIILSLIFVAIIMVEIHYSVEMYLKFKKLIILLNEYYYELDISDEIMRLYIVFKNINKTSYDVLIKMDKQFCFNFEIFYPFKQNTDTIISDIKKIDAEFKDVIINYKDIYEIITHFEYNYNDLFTFASNIYKSIFLFKNYNDFDFRQKCHFLSYYDKFINNLKKIHSLKDGKKYRFINKISNLSLLKEFKFLSFTVYYPGYQCMYIKYSKNPIHHTSFDEFEIKLVDEYRYEYTGESKCTDTIYKE